VNLRTGERISKDDIDNTMAAFANGGVAGVVTASADEESGKTESEKTSSVASRSPLVTSLRRRGIRATDMLPSRRGHSGRWRHPQVPSRVDRLGLGRADAINFAGI